MLFSNQHDFTATTPTTNNQQNQHQQEEQQQQEHWYPFYIGPIVVSTTNVAHGRGIVASRNIQAGECIMVIPPAVSCNMATVWEEWKTHYSSTSTSTTTSTPPPPLTTTTGLEHVAEQVLIKTMKELLQSNHESDKAKAQSFMLQVSSSQPQQHDDDSSTSSATVTNHPALLAALVGHHPTTTRTLETMPIATHVPDDTLLQDMIRRNAFGPDFWSYDMVETQWKTFCCQENNENDDSKRLPSNSPSRLLGLYPLAAMINHSCVPNAVRVFVMTPGKHKQQHKQENKWMMVHATTTIQQGEEIVWSYLPPTIPFPQRRQLLQQQHGFSCHCTRCQQEQEAFCINSDLYVLPEFLIPFSATTSSTASLLLSSDHGRQQLIQGLLDWEDQNFGNNNTNRPSNQLRRYWKMGNAHLYMNYFNAVLMDMAHHHHDPQQVATNLVVQVMELHFCFVSCNYACTEHLSILHLCYELVSLLHSQSTSDPTSTIAKVQFWTEQLKRAHLVRYGPLGNQIQHVRTVMKHTQTILRNKNGLEMALYDFI